MDAASRLTATVLINARPFKMHWRVQKAAAHLSKPSSRFRASRFKSALGVETKPDVAIGSRTEVGPLGRHVASTPGSRHSSVRPSKAEAIKSQFLIAAFIASTGCPCSYPAPADLSEWPASWSRMSFGTPAITQACRNEVNAAALNRVSSYRGWWNPSRRKTVAPKTQ